jgi:hypothetical protein
LPSYAGARRGRLERGAAYDTRSMAGLIERAVVVYLKQIGFNEEPPER